MDNIDNIKADIKFIRELDFADFDIPMYQRPYRWQTSHVETLLNSIRDNMSKEEYRMGSIIVNRNKDTGKLDIVDGQQRLTTLSLLFMCLDSATKYKLACKYRHLDSKQNIYANFRFIRQWLDLNGMDGEEFKKFILDKCSVVMINAADLSEAFQMFDSQNGRGKDLEAYNLLKAYHLRAIDNETTQLTLTAEKIRIDREWHDSEREKTSARNSEVSLLKFVVNELYRVRQWSKKHRGYNFKKSKVKEFKGVQFVNDKSPLPLHNHSFLLYLYFKETEGISKRSAHDDGQNPFVSINMDIINGQMFFSYIKTYVSAYKYLFEDKLDEDSPLVQFRADYTRYCNDYEGASRTGDKYIKDVYISLIMALYDRFGDKGVVDYYKYLYNLAYRERLENDTVFYSTVSEFPKEIFHTIASAIDETGLKPLIEEASKDIACKRLGKKEKEVAQYILSNTKAEIECVNNKIEIDGRKYQVGERITKMDFNNGTK